MGYNVNDISIEQFIKFKKGDAVIFELIFGLYENILFRYALKVCRDQFVAEDIVQEAFVVLYQKKQMLDSPAAIYPFLYTIVKRLLIKDFKKSVRKEKVKTDMTYSWSEETMHTVENIENKDIINLLQRMVDQLPEGQRRIYQLNKISGHTCGEIAQSLAISTFTVKNQLKSASKKIRVKLKKINIG